MRKIQYSALMLLLLTIVFLTSCKREDINYPGFGSIRINASAGTPNVPVVFIIKIDGISVDTLDGKESYQKSFNTEIGNRHVTIINQKDGKELFNDDIAVDLQKEITLPTMMIRDETLLVDDYDPAVIKPAPGKMLIRFITADPALPQTMNVKVALIYISYNTGSMVEIPITEIKNLSHTAFSDYIELSDPYSYDPDGYQYYYVLEGWNAETNEQVMSIVDGTQAYSLYYDIGGAIDFIPNNVLTAEIPVPSGEYRICNVLFQRVL